MTISSARITIKIDAEQTSTAGVSAVTSVTAIKNVIDFTNGTGANQASAVWTSTRTLSASATEDLDFAGSLTDAFGTTVAADRIKAIYVEAASGNTNDVNVARSSSNGVPMFLAASDGIPVSPGGALLLVAPNANAINVTAGTGDKLTFTNSAGTTSVTYTIAVIYTV